MTDAERRVRLAIARLQSRLDRIPEAALEKVAEAIERATDLAASLPFLPPSSDDGRLDTSAIIGG